MVELKGKKRRTDLAGKVRQKKEIYEAGKKSTDTGQTRCATDGCSRRSRDGKEKRKRDSPGDNRCASAIGALAGSCSRIYCPRQIQRAEIDGCKCRQ